MSESGGPGVSDDGIGRSVPLIRPWKCAACGRQLGKLFGPERRVVKTGHTIEVKCEKCGKLNSLEEG